MPYTQKLLKKMLFVKDNGFNIFAMLHLFRKRSKLNQEVPEEVVSLVCDEYIKNHDSIKKDFPYFLQVLKKQSGLYFARKNEKEGIRFKSEASTIGNILGRMINEPRNPNP